MHDPISIIILLIAGVSCIIGVLKYWEKRKQIIQNGIEVKGIVYEILDISINNEANYPMIRFVTKDGVWITEKGDWTSTSLKAGQEVTVIYNSQDPKEFIYKITFDWSAIMIYLVFLGGLVCIGVGLWFAYNYLTSKN